MLRQPPPSMGEGWQAVNPAVVATEGVHGHEAITYNRLSRQRLPGNITPTLPAPFDGGGNTIDGYFAATSGAVFAASATTDSR
jgi:hypothetical protein